jgi:hexosaminidase
MLFKIYITFILSCIINCIIEEKNHITNLMWPMPNSLKYGTSHFHMSRNFMFNFIQKHHANTTEAIVNIYNETFNRYKENTHPKNSTPEYYYFIDVHIDVETHAMENFTLKSNLTNYEYYRLEITDHLDIKLNCKYQNGLLRGLETLSQIIIFNDDNQDIIFSNMPLVIEDKPKYAYRGLMIDASKHYISVSKIKEIIRGMLYSKMNVLHWRLTDDDLFSYKSDVVVTNSNSYSKAIIEEIIDYAHIRGVTIIPEVDNPAHTRSWQLNNTLYPNNMTIVNNDKGVLDPTLDLTYDLVRNVTREVYSLFINGDYSLLHLGGQEVLNKYWNNTHIKTFMKKEHIPSIRDLENYYYNRVAESLPNKTNYIYWVDNNSKFHNILGHDNTILMYQGVSKSLPQFLSKLKKDLNKAKDIILTPKDLLFLECGLGDKYGDDTKCGKYKTWKSIYNIKLLETTDSFNILGYQASLFGDLADEYSIIGKIFPRVLSLGERLWSDNEDQDMKSVFVRMINQIKRLNHRGVRSISITSNLCEISPFDCLNNIS